MDKQRCLQIQTEFFRTMTQRRVLTTLQRSKAEVLHLLDDRALAELTYALIQGKRCEPGMILVICRRALESVCPEPHEGWIKAIYQYLRGCMYPHLQNVRLTQEQSAAYQYFILALEFFLQREQEFIPFDSMTDFQFLTPQELAQSNVKAEYLRLLDEYSKYHVYAMLRISRVATRFDLLAHVAGVHYVSMHAARSMARAGLPLDLGLVSGAAVGHDFGKLGCRSSEERRIPYLHYYYTDIWFHQHDMPSIGHVAANHSTWDLELENLPVECMLLIYADFRVKRLEVESTQERMHIYTLQDSYDIILNKLDNVDDVKRLRYRYVYSKLRDFERFMQARGLRDDLGDDSLIQAKQPAIALLDEDGAVEYWKYAAIEHNIILMHRLSQESSFGDMLEAARGEKDWKNLRAYLNIFEEYHSYMTQRQKVMTLNFLYELLMHGEGDIRRQAAALMGILMVHYDVEYRKELPEDVAPPQNSVTGLTLWADFINRILYPDHKIIDRHKSYIRYTLKLVLDSALTNCKAEQRRMYLNAFLGLFEQVPQDDAPAFMLLDAVQKVPLEICNGEDIRRMVHAMFLLSDRNSLEIKAAILRCLKYFYTFLNPDLPCLAEADSIVNALDLMDHVTLIFLRYEIAKLTNASKAELQAYQQHIMGDGRTISEICLENLKSATPWVIKETNISLLLRLVRRDNEGQALLVATHLSNLVKVSEKVVVRHRAGLALVQLAPVLPLAQRNEIAIELCKGLETGQYEFSKYIPEYLGQFSLFLHPKELNEIIAELEKFIKGGNDRAATVALDTIGVMLQAYPDYKKRFAESNAAFEARRTRLLGLAMCGLSHYHEPVSREAFLVIARHVFASSRLNFEEKARIFSIINKKMLTLICEEQGSEFLLFNHAASLNHIYRFITEYTIKVGEFHLAAADTRVAYFPGTFDPFSLSHKGIIREILDLGFDVYLALDEFSWSKKTQPRMLRRKIMAMSTADLFGVYLFPDDFPVNIASIRDLKRLREIFTGKRVHMVVGSDVVFNASSYCAEPAPESVHQFDHIVFRRNTEEEGDGFASLLHNRLKANVIQLSLPPYLEDVSSSRIRDNIDLNRDISNLIDPVAQKFIYDYSLYLREPQYKEVLYGTAIRFRNCSPILETDILAAEHVFCRGLPATIRQAMHRPGMEMIISYESPEDVNPSGFICFHEISTANLYQEFQDAEFAEYIRANTSGKIIVISALAATDLSMGEEVCQLLLTEALASCLKRDYTYAIYRDARGNVTPHVREVLTRQGFQLAEEFRSISPIYVVDMKFPITLLHDVEPMIKEPLRSNPRVQASISVAHKRMQTALTKLYPGSLVLSFDSRVMNAQLMHRITLINGVPNQKLAVRRLGPAMCVPYGKILRDVVVPNTVTKTLHVEKVFDEKVRSFSITHFPNYSPLKTQVDTIRSFERPLLLVDDLLHKGNRVRELDPMFREDGIEIKKYVCGILTGRGKDLMTIQHHDVESVYFIPNLRMWMSEVNMYPFIGGDSAKQSRLDPLGSLHSVNLILPYVMPRFIKGCSQEVLIEFSQACLTNAYELLCALERAYRESFERNLTLSRLGEVLIFPRRPDKGDCIEYDGTLAPSSYVKNDMIQLSRLDPKIQETEGF